MPHQCVRCGTIHEDGDKAILTGCTSCGKRVFFYIRKERLEDVKKETEELKLTEKDKDELEKDIYELVGKKQDDTDPVILDFESIRVLQPGKYEFDLVSMFKKEPLIFKISEGKYVIDLPTSFKEALDK
tara:strand:- start:206 stop:592 length:387 start_codon:yes stop_codon:yes gene_type:complete